MCVTGEPKTPQFFDFGIVEPITKPQNQVFFSLETPGHLKQIKKNARSIQHIIFINIEKWKPEVLTFLEKAGADK